MWKCTLRFNAEPNLWTDVTAPLLPNGRPVALRYHRVMRRRATRRTPSTRSVRRASNQRRLKGTVSTHWRVATHGITRSTQCAEVSAIRRPAQLGQNPRVLQENSTSRW